MTCINNPFFGNIKEWMWGGKSSEKGALVFQLLAQKELEEDKTKRVCHSEGSRNTENCLLDEQLYT